MVSSVDGAAFVSIVRIGYSLHRRTQFFSPSGSIAVCDDSKSRLFVKAIPWSTQAVDLNSEYSSTQAVDLNSVDLSQL